MARRNQQATTQASLTEALQQEQAIADEAATVRGDEVGLTAELFLKLTPLLRKPIPAGFITEIGAVSGKPYASTGIKSVQVQIDRMDNVLTPLGWRHEVDYQQDGKLAHVVVTVLDLQGAALFSRESWGGVNQASTIGNLFKGSYTNAAKRAFAMVGPGHEVYLGATDLDPDVNEDSAKEQTRQPAASAAAAQAQPLGDKARAKVLAAFEAAGIAGESLDLYLAAAGVHDTDAMTAAHANRLRELLDEELARQAAENDEAGGTA